MSDDGTDDADWYTTDEVWPRARNKRAGIGAAGGARSAAPWPGGLRGETKLGSVAA